MNMFLKEMAVTFRRDSVTRRPRVNKEGSKLDALQKQINKAFLRILIDRLTWANSRLSAKSD